MSPSLRPLKVILYAAFIGLLLASYISPLQEIVEDHSNISTLQANLEEVQKENAAREKAAAAKKAKQAKKKQREAEQGRV